MLSLIPQKCQDKVFVLPRTSVMFSTEVPRYSRMLTFADVFLWFGGDLTAIAHKHLIPNDISCIWANYGVSKCKHFSAGDRSRDLSRISLKSLLSIIPPTSDLPPAERLKRLADSPKKQPKIPRQFVEQGWDVLEPGTKFIPPFRPRLIIQIYPDTESIRCSRSGTRGPQEKSGEC